MTDFENSFEEDTPQDYLDLVADGLRAQGAKIIGTPIVEDRLEWEEGEMIKVRFMDEINGVVCTVIPAFQEGSNEL